MNSDALGISDLSIGVDSNGMNNYINTLLDSLFVKTQEKLQDTSELVTVISSGWQGFSRDQFIEDLNSSISEMVEKIDTEKTYLQNELNELLYSYQQIDSNLMETIEL